MRSATGGIRRVALALALASALAVALAAAPAFAQPAEPDSGARPWAVGLATQKDDDSNSGLLATLNWGVRESTWLTFGAGSSRSPNERAGVSVRTLYAGVDHRFGPLGMTFQAGLWGDPDALESTEYRGSLYVQRHRFRAGVEHERREIDIVFTALGALGRPVTRTVDLVSTATGARARVELAAPWQLHLASRRYDYSRNLALLPRISQLNLLSTSPLTLAYGFLRYEHSVDVEWENGNRVLTFGVSRDRSAVDRSRLETARVGLLFPAARRMDIEVSLGRARSGEQPSAFYGGVLLLIYGGH